MSEGGDAVDRILLDELAARAPSLPEPLVVVDDSTGGLVEGLPALGGAVRVHCDDYLAEQHTVRAKRNGTSVAVHAALDESLFRDARTVLMRLPKSLAALDEVSGLIGAAADPDVVLLAGGRTKHMTHGMNDVLARHLTLVVGSLGRQKCRVLVATGARRDAPTTRYPRTEHHSDLGLTVCAHGGVFAGTSVDRGTRLLLQATAKPADARVAVDLGCGSGILAAVMATRHPGAEVHAVDVSAAACRSAAATAAANRVADRVTVHRSDGLAGVPAGSVDLVLCNPPFHQGNARDSTPAFEMFRNAGAALRPGGELWTVFNSHLPYRSALRRLIGPTEVAVQDRHYMVTRSVRRDG
jgi:16S rRNA (guanine1207-N2)-methyltransferase